MNDPEKKPVVMLGFGGRAFVEVVDDFIMVVLTDVANTRHAYRTMLIEEARAFAARFDAALRHLEKKGTRT